MTKEKLIERFETLIDVFSDTPSLPASFADLRRLYEDLLCVIDLLSPAKKIGFVES